MCMLQPKPIKKAQQKWRKHTKWIKVKKAAAHGLQMNFEMSIAQWSHHCVAAATMKFQVDQEVDAAALANQEGAAEVEEAHKVYES